MLTIDFSGRSVRIDEAGGARISSVEDRDGFQFLAPGNPPVPALVKRGDLAATGYQGWIDCFPTIEPESFRTEGRDDVELTGHGLLWPRPWTVDARTDRDAVLRCSIEALDVTCTRRVTLTERSLVVASEFRNRSSEPLNYVWASHPLLAADDSTWIELRDLDDVARWPESEGGSIRLDAIWPSDSPRRRWADLPVGTAVKLFLPWPATGVAFSAGGRPRHVDFRVSGDGVSPHLGLWLNREGFPADSPLSHFAIEPTIGSTDSRAVSMERGTAGVIAAGAAVRLEVTLTF
jgi:hypothetical protein